MTINERILKIITDIEGGERQLFAKRVGKSKQQISNWINEEYNVGINVINDILTAYPEVNKVWLLTGEGEMLKGNIGNSKKLIPFYDDVVTIGGTNEQAADTRGVTSPSEYIDAGDWFKNATAAIRHYGDSMTEYPAGCILALREVEDWRLIVPGKDYVVETSEYRVTKKIQLCDDPEYIRACSTNEEKYEDGTLIHQPFNIPLSLINKIFEVLGYVFKKGGGTIVFSNQR